MSLAQPAARATKYDDLLRLPEGVTGEIVDGELHASPRPAVPHAHSCTFILGGLSGSFGGRGGAPPPDDGWWVLVEPELHLGPDVLVPDLAGWRRSRVPRLPNAAWIEIAPDWVCEILSPRTAGHDRVRKMPAYARHGVEHLWLVDPIAHTVEVYRRQDPTWVVVATHAADEVARIPPFEELELALTPWWLPEDEPPAPRPPVPDGGPPE